MESKIQTLLKQLDTENIVSNTIKKHLATKQTELVKLTKERENQKDKESSELEALKASVVERREQAQEDFENIKRMIGQDDDYRYALAMKEAAKGKEEDEKVEEKMSMDEAARFIQRKWTWF